MFQSKGFLIRHRRILFLTAIGVSLIPLSYCHKGLAIMSAILYSAWLLGFEMPTPIKRRIKSYKRKRRQEG